MLGALIVPVFLWLYWLAAALHASRTPARLAVILILAIAAAAMVAGEVYERYVGTKVERCGVKYIC